MFNIGLGEMLFIAILALLALGPERLPKVMRQLGEIAYQIRIVVQQFNSQFADELRPIREIQSLTSELNPMRQIGAAIDPSIQPPPTLAPPAPSPGTANAPAAPAAPSFAGLGGANPMAQISQQMAASAPPAAAAQPPPTATAAAPAAATDSQP